MPLYGDAAGEGPLAILLHAGGERRTVWQPVARALAAVGCSSVAYDQRGHGGNPSLRAQRLDEFAEDVVAMVDAADGGAAAAPGAPPGLRAGGRPVLVGASLGGFASMLALAEPGLERRLAGLILVDVVPDPVPERTRAWLRAQLGPRAVAPVIDDILSRGQELRAIVRGLTLPVMLVRGGGDSPFGDDDNRRFLELVPHARIVTIGEAGHLVAQDAPEQLAGLIAGFVLSGGRRGR